MSIIESILTGVALAMDALAVSICMAVCDKNIKVADTVKAATFFGVFQFIMPCIGFYLGAAAISYIEKYDHWVAFILLFAIGANMVYQAYKGDETPQNISAKSLKALFILAVATSIDALAVGVSLSCMQGSIILSAAIIGIVTFAISFCGGIFGRKIGSKYDAKFSVLGGVILIGIGIKTLYEHTL